MTSSLHINDAPATRLRKPSSTRDVQARTAMASWLSLSPSDSLIGLPALKRAALRLSRAGA